MRSANEPVILGYCSSQATLRWAPGFEPALAYQGRSTPWSLNAFKGTLGEQILERGVTAGLFERARPAWVPLTPHQVGNRGIDALFVKVGRDGNVRGVMIADAKFQGSRLIQTRTGQQMSHAWVRPRLRATAKEYGRAASALAKGGVRITSAAGQRVLRVPLGNGRTVGVWVGARGLHASVPVDPARLLHQLRRICAALGDAGQRGSYAARLLEAGVNGNQFSITVQRLDVQTGKRLGRPRSIRGSWRKLSKGLRAVLDRCMRTALAKHVARPADVDALCRAARQDPSFLLDLRTTPRVPWHAGIDARMIYVTLSTGLASMLFSLFSSAWRGELSLRSARKDGVLGGGSAATTYIIYAQVEMRVATGVGREIARALPLRAVNGSAIGGVAGLAAGIGAGLFVAFGAYKLGMVDIRQARIMGVAGVAGAVASALVPAGAFGAATAFGTAGTGVAIGTLSGAAYNSAALAWIGGAAGGGAAAGSALLTGGVALIGFAAAYGVHGAFARRDRIDRLRLLEARLKLVEESLRSRPTALTA